jgi:2'-5' RNA ligase
MRLFLAIRVADDIRRAVAAMRPSLEMPGHGWRFVRDDGLHLTIRFLGDVDPSRRDALHATWRDAASGTGPLTLRVRGATAFPRGRNPRYLWLGLLDETRGGALAQLAERVERAARWRGFSAASRPFAPHVTLARSRRAAAIEMPGLERIGDLGSFVAERLVLYRSELSPGGSRYHEVDSYLLAVPDAS